VRTEQVTFITIVFCLPTANPVDSQTLNYTPVTVGIVFVLTVGTWVLWAHRWFTGPIRQIEAEAAGIDISEPGAFEDAEKRGELGHSGVTEGNTLLAGVKKAMGAKEEPKLD
jgi:hypothetical protein